MLTGLLLASSLSGTAVAEIPGAETSDPLPMLRSGESLLLATAPADINLEEGVLIAESLGAESFFLLPDSKGIEFTGFRIGFGSARGLAASGLEEPAELPDGIWYFPRGGVFSDASGDFLIPNNGVVLAGDVLSDTLARMRSSGSVTCRDGYYACCGKNQHGQWRAKCIPNADNPPGGTDYPSSCINGGEVATRCSTGVATVLMIENFDIIDREDRIKD